VLRLARGGVVDSLHSSSAEVDILPGLTRAPVRGLERCTLTRMGMRDHGLVLCSKG